MPAGYRIHIQSSNMYYPYGSLQPGRCSQTAVASRYGFQGQEKDNEIRGEGNSLNYKYRMHDARIGRFFALDPLAPEYPHNSPYAFSENVVINSVELEGLEKQAAIDGSIIYGPYDLKVINDDILKKNDGKMHLSRVFLANKAILTDNDINQNIYPLPDVIPKGSRSMFKFESRIEGGVSFKSKAKVFGYGYDLSFGISQQLTKTVFTENYAKSEYVYNEEPPTLDGAVGFGMVGIGLSKDLTTDNVTSTGNLGPLSATTDFRSVDLEFTIFEFSQVTVVGASYKLSMDPSAFKTGHLMETTPKKFAPADKTRTKLPLIK